MHNMGQIKSKQFYRRPSVEPIARASSFHTIDNKRQERYSKNRNKQPQNQNVYDLANIMQQLQDLKPKNTEENPTFRNKRAETLVPGPPKLKSIAPKTTPISLLQLLKQHTSTKDKVKRLNTLQLQGQQKYIRKVAIQKRSREKTAQNKIIPQQANQNHINFQTIRFPEGVCKANASQDLMEYKMFQGDNQQQLQNQKVKTLSKNLTDYAFIPNNKLTINNIDRLIFKNSKTSSKNVKKSERELMKVNQKQQLVAEKQLLDYQQELVQVAAPKQKKSLTNHKIPQFIKASLQGYQHQSQYIINNLILPTKFNQPKTPKNIDDFIPHPQKPQTKQIQICPTQKQSEENLLGAKLNLYQKQKRKSSKIIDYIRERRQNNMTAEQTSKRAFKLTSRQKPKKTCVEDEMSHKICGWEQGDAASPDLIDFRI